MNWIKITNIYRKEKENILVVIAIISLIGIGIEIFLTGKVEIGPVEVTLIIGIVTAFVSTKKISATINNQVKILLSTP